MFRTISPTLKRFNGSTLNTLHLHRSFDIVSPLIQQGVATAAKEFYNRYQQIEQEADMITQIQKKLLTPKLNDSELDMNSKFIPRPFAFQYLSELFLTSKPTMLTSDSCTGKTTTLLTLLSKPSISTSVGEFIPAVCRLQLREVKTFENGLEVLRQSLGITDTSLTLYELLDKLRNAFNQFKSSRKRVLCALWIEDIHACCDEFAQALSSRLIDLRFPVIHTISETSGYSKLRSLSGHRNRLLLLPFPPILDQEIITGLSTKIESEFRYLSADGSWQDIIFKEEAVVSKKSAELLAFTFGDNLGQIDRCLAPLRGFTSDEAVKENIAKIVALEAGDLMEQAGPEAVKNPNLGPACVIALHKLFDSLAEKEGKEAINAKQILTPIFSQHPSLKHYPFEPVKTLIKENLLRYEDPILRGSRVTFKRRSLLHSWQLIKKDMEYSDDLKFALASAYEQLGLKSESKPTPI